MLVEPGYGMMETSSFSPISRWWLSRALNGTWMTWDKGSRKKQMRKKEFSHFFWHIQQLGTHYRESTSWKNLFSPSHEYNSELWMGGMVFMAYWTDKERKFDLMWTFISLAQCHSHLGTSSGWKNDYVNPIISIFIAVASSTRKRL